MSTDVKIPQALTQTHHPDAKGVKLPIYMDNHATTQMDPRVLEEMLPYFVEKFGNSASRNHSFGWAAEEGVETARERIAKLVGATTKEIIFTSGATESDNLAIKGVAEMYREKGNHIITAVTEHKAVLDTCKRLEKYGYRVTYMPVQKDGLIDLDDLKRAMDDKTILVTIMAANNEIGVLQPVTEIGKLCHERGVIFHTDATQYVGKVPTDVNKQNIDVMSISAHKMYGPKGVGALYVRRKNPRVQLSALIDGGGHERGMRSGTLNVPGIVGLGKACAIAQEELSKESCRLAGLRNRLRDRIMGPSRRNLHQRLVGTPSPRQPEHQFRLRRRRVAPDGHQRHRGIERFGLHLGHARAIVCTEGSRHRRRLGAQLDPFRHRPLQHRGRSRLRSRPRNRNRRAPARTFSALRNGKRRHQPERRKVGRRSALGQRFWKGRGFSRAEKSRNWLGL